MTLGIAHTKAQAFNFVGASGNTDCRADHEEYLHTQPGTLKLPGKTRRMSRGDWNNGFLPNKCRSSGREILCTNNMPSFPRTYTTCNFRSTYRYDGACQELPHACDEETVRRQSKTCTELDQDEFITILRLSLELYFAPRSNWYSSVIWAHTSWRAETSKMEAGQICSCLAC